MVPNLQSFESDFKNPFFYPTSALSTAQFWRATHVWESQVWVGGGSLDIYNFFYIPAKARATWSQDLVLATVVDREV